MGQRVWLSGRAREQGGPGTDWGRTAATVAIICPGKRNVTAAGHGLGALGGREGEGRGGEGRGGGGQERSDQGGAVTLAA